MNSVPPYSALRNPIGSNGAVDEDQRRRVEHMLRSHPFRRRPTLILIHHHFTKGEQKTTGRMGNIWGVVEGQTMKLRGKRELLKTFREVGADLVLHGHFHENRMYRRKGVLFLNGGGTVLKREAGELPVNIIRYVRGGISVETIGVAAVDPLVCTSPPMRTHAWDSAPREAGRGGRERDFGRVPFRRPALNPKE
jgi:3',5'-cyclic AMP phosphodiesterase CpdA